MTITENRQDYVCYIPKCPKCKRWGNLHSHTIRSGKRWFGPYYEIRHLRKEYSKEKYIDLRESGLTSAQAHKYNRFISRNEYYCYFGKICPIQLPLVIVRSRSPRGRKVRSRLQKEAIASNRSRGLRSDE
jgi:hypothetical protein